ncbi:hypothetical protein [Streptomyces stackebrandtii]|uniref:hypothetical protein n=1 Tax=Streptomyces stackebrandtii TaxID=3051177 RepID=UPI0028DB8574|nr:hypothetical protein [Streptomyces sp. DSM 40976]
MIYRNFIAPSRDFTQLANRIIRHPRLNSDAARILNWQLSLPGHSRQTLSETAKRARIGACSFNQAKRQLKAEGYVHERRVQGEGGLWATQQLVSSEPLRAHEAAKIFGSLPFRAGVERVFPQMAPSATVPAAGHPVAPPTDGHPEKDPWEDTSILPPEVDEPEPEPEDEPEPVDEPEPGHESADEPGCSQLDEARALVGALPLLSPSLRHIPPGMRDELTQLVAHWLAAGHTSADVHQHVLRGLPGAGIPVHRPGGLVRYLLRHVPPLHEAPPAGPPRLSPRLEGTQECAGRHTQPMLFRPVAEGQTLCPECAGARQGAPQGS